MDEITGRIAVHRIEKGSVVTRGMLESEEQITGEMEEAVIAGFRAEDLYQAVGGVLRAGDRIHIYCIDKEETAKEKQREIHERLNLLRSGQFGSRRADAKAKIERDYEEWEESGVQV